MYQVGDSRIRNLDPAPLPLANDQRNSLKLRAIHTTVLYLTEDAFRDNTYACHRL